MGGEGGVRGRGLSPPCKPNKKRIIKGSISHNESVFTMSILVFCRIVNLESTGWV